MTHRTIFIVNPTSRAGLTARLWKQRVERLRRQGLSLEHQFTEAPGHAQQLTQQALADRYDHIVAVGGDGTFNEVLNGFFGDNQAIHPPAFFSAVSFATGGDLARVIPLGGEPEDLRRLCEDPYPFTSDVIQAQFIGEDGQPAQRYFINVSDIGIGCETVIRVNRQSKKLGGRISFLGAALSALFSAKNLSMEILADEKTFFKGRVSMAVIANGRYFGGGMYASPTAELDDGLMDLTIFHDFSRFQILLNLPSIYTGKYIHHQQVIRGQAKTVDFISPHAFPFEMDGELPGTGNVHYRIIPGALNMLLSRPHTDNSRMQTQGLVPLSLHP